MTPAIWHARNLRFLKFHHLVIEAVTLLSFWYMKPNHGWSYSKIINVYVLKSSHNPGQNLLRQKLKIQYIQEMTQCFKFQILPLTPPPPFEYQSWICLSFVVQSLKSCQQNWFGGRGVFSLKNRFSFLSQQFCPKL